MKRIAVICERDRAYGRGLCLGIAGAAVREKDWFLEFVDDLSVVKSTRLAGFDGVIARISNDGIAADLKATGLPVVDVYSARNVGRGVRVDEVVAYAKRPAAARAPGTRKLCSASLKLRGGLWYNTTWKTSTRSECRSGT